MLDTNLHLSDGQPAALRTFVHRIKPVMLNPPQPVNTETENKWLTLTQLLIPQ